MNGAFDTLWLFSLLKSKPRDNKSLKSLFEQRAIQWLCTLDWWHLGSLLLSMRPLEGVAGAKVCSLLVCESNKAKVTRGSAVASAQQFSGPGVHFNPVWSCAAAVIVSPKNCELQENKVPSFRSGTEHSTWHIAGRNVCL